MYCLQNKLISIVYNVYQYDSIHDYYGYNSI